MESNSYTMYRHARKRLRHKKQAYLHFAWFVIISLFIHLINLIFDIDAAANWFTWFTTGWGVILLLHFVKVFIIDSSVNKTEELYQAEKLKAWQQRKVNTLEKNI